ncbi:MAG: histidinol dehydrogenase, partial [Usitatibacter sp.]
MPEPRRLSTSDAGFEAALARLLAFEAAQDEGVERATAEILEAVRTRGDAALLEYTARFDRWSPASAQELAVPLGEAREALRALGARVREALEFAAARIRSYHERQVQESWRIDGGDGTVLGQQVTPLDRVGLYV